MPRSQRLETFNESIGVVEGHNDDERSRPGHAAMLPELTAADATRAAEAEDLTIGPGQRSSDTSGESRLRRHPGLVTAALVVVLAAISGAVAAHSSHLAVLVCLGALLMGLAATDLAYVAVACVPAVWIVQRAPVINVSYPDVLVAGTGAAAFLAGVHKKLQPSNRLLFSSFGLYLGSLTGSLAYHQYLRSDLEWLHRVGLVAGAALVGAWTVQRGLHHRALQLLLLVASVVSISAVVYSFRHGFAAAYTLGFQKNYLGSITAQTLIVALVAGKEFRLPTRWFRLGVALTFLGMLASQSRGSMLTLAVGLTVWFLRTGKHRRYGQRRMVAFLVLALAVFVGISVKAQIDAHSRFGSIGQRLTVEAQTQQLWIHHPLTGVGLRFFDLPQFAGYQPPNNVLNEILAEAGVPGLIGFLVFIVGSVLALYRARGDLALAGLSIVVGRFTHGLVDIYWVAGTTTLTWLIAGMGLARRGDPPEDRSLTDSASPEPEPA